MGTPTVNGHNAGVPGAVEVPAGVPATVAVPVTNTGTATLTGVTATMPGGALQCEADTLGSGQSTTCSGTVTPDPGHLELPITATGEAPSGAVSTTGTAHLTAVEPGGAPDPDGCQCDLTLGTPVVDGHNAGSPGSAVEVPAGTTVPVTVTITNTGPETLTPVSGTIPGGSMSCPADPIAPGQSATCTGSFTPGVGTQAVPVTIVCVTLSGQQISTNGTVYVQGEGSGSTPGTDPVPGSGEAGTAQTGTGPSSGPGATGASALTGAHVVRGTAGTRPRVRAAAGASGHRVPAGAVAAGGGGTAQQAGDRRPADASTWLNLIALLATAAAAAIALRRRAVAALSALPRRGA